jgi:hypothetical protein
MSIFKVTSQDFQSILVTTNPNKYYSSSSSGITGSLRVFARKSFVEKDIGLFSDIGPFDDSVLESEWQNIKSKIKISDLKEFFTKIQKTNLSETKSKTLDVIRFTPEDDYKNFSKFVSGSSSLRNVSKKLVIKDNLSSYYRTAYPSAHWAYSNYHCLNFFSSSTVPTSSVLLYPNVDDGSSVSGYSKGRYGLNGAFSFDFYINPRYNALDSIGHFKAGTIFHLSSSYALSLITGSLKDVNGLPAAFRLQLQLSHSADISPSLASNGSYPKNLVFLSDDNCLKLNNWHHVVVRWGTNVINHGAGSFNVDGIDKGKFVIPSGTISPLAYPNNAMSPTNPDVLCIGNFYEGTNSGNDRLKRFFLINPSVQEGTYTLDDTVSDEQGPTNFKFNHPLQSEIHDLSIKNFYVTDSDIQASSSTGISNLNNVKFYLPPFFTLDSPLRSDADRNLAGTFTTPSRVYRGITTTPFSVEMSFGVNGHYINTENFLKDFASNNTPRQLFLTGTAVPYDSNLTKTANEILYSQPEIRKRNLLILPCDDGNFYPNYDVINTQNINVLVKSFSDNYNTTSSFSVDPKKVCYVDDLGNYSPGFITLNNMVMNLSGTNIFDEQSIDTLIGFSPKNPTKYKGSAINQFENSIYYIFNNVPRDAIVDFVFEQQNQIPLSVPLITKDSSSNQVVFFDISNLFYGMSILPGSFMIKDSSITGSGGAIGLTIKDDGNGTLYRADSLTPHCTWNSVGTIFYNEGIIAIKSPHLYFFGKDQYEISFKGEQNIHVLRLESIAPQNYLNSSSNPTYRFTPSTNRPNEYDPNFVYITGINYHDDNLNVVMKTQLAQPIMKRQSEKIFFKVKYDF